jgi:4'-phosphopantetheinyl transferase
MKVYINDDIENFDLQQALQGISEQRRDQALRYKH